MQSVSTFSSTRTHQRQSHHPLLPRRPCSHPPALALDPTGPHTAGRVQISWLKAQLANVEVLAPGTPISAEGVFTAQPPKRRIGPMEDDVRGLRLVGLGEWRRGSRRRPCPCCPPNIIFPVSRTCAHPKAPPPQFSLGKGEKKQGRGTKAFLRLALRKSFPCLDLWTFLRPPSEPSLPLLSEGEQSPELQTSFEDLCPDTPPPPIATKIGPYPLDSYDVTLIENDRQTWELLRKYGYISSSATSQSLENGIIILN
ncbi:hypothetical protein B0H16DRAFT_1727498 [Mycena metata]|uniref:Uncharacterized protein n=1 Tax=Mycena metata TaxID=1033252 RepID=A0AAD7IKC0_9AGAR|nr:hypothetical protein B0H16DRAFT_1727498 [Mycena metata]